MNLIETYIKNVFERKTSKGIEKVIVLANNMIYVPNNQELAIKQNIGKQFIVYYYNGQKTEQIKK